MENVAQGFEPTQRHLAIFYMTCNINIMRHVNKRIEFREAIEAALIGDDHDEGLDGADSDYEVPVRLATITQGATDKYLSYKQDDGLLKGVFWWQVANGYTAIALHDSWSGIRTNYDILAKAIRDCEKSNSAGRGFINDFNDDSLWWALCCLHLYSLHHDPWFLEGAEEVWRHVREYVCERNQEFFRGIDMEGGVFWKSKAPDDDRLGSISTGLFAELSVRLALLHLQNPTLSTSASNPGPSADEYIESARNSLGWILRCRYIPQQAVVLDGIDLHAQKADDRRFTYNTGVALGTCALLYEATGEEEYMLLACHMALKSMSRRLWIEDGGVLTETGAYDRARNEPCRNSDGIGFKSVLVRELGVLFDVIRRKKCRIERAAKTRVAIRRFINVNFHSQLVRNTDGEGVYGPWWNGESSFWHLSKTLIDLEESCADS